ncbi:ankyrin repeat-containing domain protein [Aspergillus pseudodeflectus]|uniref:Ankyrin repeat-containing domain protein n=1 Tax=Aspergillus pseudodeflectus TaxID=176178 RepID=A0ABR4LBQ3_9EURO
MSLHTLPDEILLDIWNGLDSPHSMNAFIRSCRRFHRIFNGSLYRYASNTPRGLAAAMDWVGQHGRVDALRRFIDELGAADVIHDPASTPLFAAAEYGQDALVRFLIQQGIDLDLQRRDHYTEFLAIGVAAKHRRESTVRLLFEAGADIEGREDFRSALLAATENGHDEIVKFLVAQGARQVSDDGDQNALCCALKENCSIEVIRLLLNENQPTDLLDRLGEYDLTPLGLAAEEGNIEGNIEAAQLLLAAGADVDAGFQFTPLKAAIGKRQEAMARFLILEAGACVGQPGIHSVALEKATRMGLHDIVQLLVEHGADPTATEISE